jgi:putative inorganic carbon (HCO3(-)) transporter
VGLVVLARSRRMLMAGLTFLLALLLWGAMGGLSPAMLPAPITERLADVPAYLGVGIEQIVAQPVNDENFSVIERLAHWLAAERMWETAPWLGVGPGSYATVYPSVRLPLWEDALGHAHNIYLNVLAETGLFGLAAYLLMWGGIVVWLWRQNRRQQSGSWEQALMVGVLGVVAHLTVHQLFDNLYVQGIQLHAALWLGAAIAIANPLPTSCQTDVWKNRIQQEIPCEKVCPAPSLSPGANAKKPSASSNLPLSARPVR